MPIMTDEIDGPVPDQPGGILYIVATPIGNLADLSPRAREVLGQVAVVAAEDTRVSRRLLDERADSVSMVSVNEHSERGAVDGLIRQLLAGRDVALVSDAGTPLISDPGYRLVAAAHEAGVRVCPLPGPCAAIAALSVAGLPSDRFFFEGFLPARTGARKKRLEALSDQPGTLIFYVPARDLGAVLGDLAETLSPDRLATLGRELTKLHETIRRDTLDELKVWVQADPNQLRGEAVLVVAGNPEPVGVVNVQALARELAAELPPSRAAGILARLTGQTRKQAWNALQATHPTGESTQ
jgi:16S rRNA (cytidine1402-2'-O)-methyltransferase